MGEYACPFWTKRLASNLDTGQQASHMSNLDTRVGIMAQGPNFKLLANDAVMEFVTEKRESSAWSCAGSGQPKAVLNKFFAKTELPTIPLRQ